jgi:carbonic anhydrase
MRVEPVRSQEQLDDVRVLFQEYWHAFRFDPCFQGFAAEVDALPGEYAPPSGRIALAIVDGRLAGCIALRRLTDIACEMKRLYVRDEFRGGGTGIALVRWLLDEARTAGYTTMYLDTMPSMQRAIAMYERLGFKRCDPYSDKPSPGAICLCLPLAPFRIS